MKIELTGDQIEEINFAISFVRTQFKDKDYEFIRDRLKVLEQIQDYLLDNFVKKRSV